MSINFLIMPIVGIIFFGVILSVIIVCLTKLKAKQMETLSIAQFEYLASELKNDNQEIKNKITKLEERIKHIDEIMQDV